jgi:hypothetical protein
MYHRPPGKLYWKASFLRGIRVFRLFSNRRDLHSLIIATWAALLVGCIPQPVAPPASAPGNFDAAAGNGEVTLSWSISDGATGYNLRRSTTGGGPYTQIALPTSTSFTDSSVVNGTTYFYVVSAYNKGGQSTDSAEASATPAIPSVPAAPTNVVATSGDRSVSISWSPRANATSYRVKRSTTRGGPYTQIATPTTTTYVDGGLTNGTVYYYVVSGVNALGEGANSVEVNAAPSPPPPSTFGTWINVTPAGIDLSGSLSCGNPGTTSVRSHAGQPGHLYAQFSCQGIWKSVNYGATWTGPVNTGTNGAAASNCEGGIAVAQNGAATSPIIYQSCIRGGAQGLWKSVDGGVNWTNYTVTPTVRQDYLPPVVDPYDQNHLLMTGHEFDSIVESTDGGQTWTAVPLNNGMLLSTQNSFVFFINTGSATTTRRTWLWIAGGANGGTWRTTTGGTTWTKVDTNESFVGSTQIYQPDNNGTVFMAGVYSTLGWGVLRSTDYGATWTHVGNTAAQSVVIGTAKNVYAMAGTADKNFTVASQPGTGTWVNPGTPSALTNGAWAFAVVNNGVNSILLGAMAQAGLWRYVEP